MGVWICVCTFVWTKLLVQNLTYFVNVWKMSKRTQVHMAQSTRLALRHILQKALYAIENKQTYGPLKVFVPLPLLSLFLQPISVSPLPEPYTTHFQDQVNWQFHELFYFSSKLHDFNLPYDTGTVAWYIKQTKPRTHLRGCSHKYFSVSGYQHKRHMSACRSFSLFVLPYGSLPDHGVLLPLRVGQRLFRQWIFYFAG